MVEKRTKVIQEGYAKMTKCSVIMDVVKAEEAIIAEDAGAVVVMELEKMTEKNNNIYKVFSIEIK